MFDALLHVISCLDVWCTFTCN